MTFYISTLYVVKSRFDTSSSKNSDGIQKKEMVFQQGRQNQGLVIDSVSLLFIMILYLKTTLNDITLLVISRIVGLNHVTM